MKATIHTPNGSSEVLQFKEIEKPAMKDDETTDAFAELEHGVHTALETYSNVHRGNGHFSLVTTHLFEQARIIVLEYLGLSKGKFTVIFCTSRGAAALVKQLTPESYRLVSSRDVGLSLGVCALAVKRKALPEGAPFQTGGGTARLISKEWIIWAKDSDKFEAGTPAIINIIAFAKALRMIQLSGKDIFLNPPTETLTAKEILYNDELEELSGQELLNELRKKLVGSVVQVPTMEGNRTFINLDNSASTRTFTPIWNTSRQT